VRQTRRAKKQSNVKDNNEWGLSSLSLLDVVRTTYFNVSLEDEKWETRPSDFRYLGFSAAAMVLSVFFAVWCVVDLASRAI
jgi:hypothetical protein